MAILRLSKPLKYDHPKGTPVTVVDKYINPVSKEEILFHAPKVRGMYYGKSVDFFNSAIALKDKCFQSVGLVNPKDAEQGNAFIDNDSVFSFFTESCSGMIMLFAAVESYVNDLIERSANEKYYKILPYKLSFGRFAIFYKKEKNLTIEERLYLSIEEKIKKVLPTIFNFQSPAQEHFWQDFIQVKKLRNAFMHSTRSKSYGANRGENSVYAQLFDLDFERLVNSVGDLIKYLKTNSNDV